VSKNRQLSKNHFHNPNGECHVMLKTVLNYSTTTFFRAELNRQRSRDRA